jgi:hypothetical protein
VGYAAKTNKTIIPIVEKGTDPKELAALQGREYIEYDPSQPQEALSKASTYLKSLKLRKEDKEKTLLIAAGIIALILLISGGEK